LENNIITISTQNTVVRFFPGHGHVLDYTCFRSIRREGAPDFLTDFSAALAFVHADPNVTNDFYLAGYEAAGRRHIFWFNFFIQYDEYTVPITIPRTGWGPEENPLHFPIEIIVEHGHVTRYRKVAYTFWGVLANGME